MRYCIWFHGSERKERDETGQKQVVNFSTVEFRQQPTLEFWWVGFPIQSFHSDHSQSVPDLLEYSIVDSRAHELIMNEAVDLNENDSPKK